MKIAMVIVVSLLALARSGWSADNANAAPSSRPNILFVIMDDVGIDQMQVFGYGGETPPSTPNIAQIAGAGIRFSNTWSMPACTTSRAVFFDGRFPFRTNVLGALGPADLANSMVSPYEMTAPKLLAKRGYDSALFGKFHLALQGHDPAGYAMPGPAALSTKHCLALTNRGGATGAELRALACQIRDGVLDRFGVELHPEPTIIGGLE